MAPLSEEEENYVRLALLLKGVTPRAVRTFFDKEFPPTYLPSTLNTNNNTLMDLKLKRIINQAQWNLLIPRNGVPDSKTFDVTLMICLIRNLTSISHPINGFDSLPLPGESTPGSDLARIKYYRNKLAHHDSNTIDSAYFNTAWGDISNDTLHIITTKGVVENIKVQEVIDQFKLTDFSGKPKFFIFQACRHQPGTRTDEADSLESQNLKGELHQDADLLVSYATTPGYKAYRELYTTEEGSWFIREMINVFKERYEETDVIHIMMEVRRKVEKCRTSNGECQMTQDLLTLRKKFFL